MFSARLIPATYTLLATAIALASTVSLAHANSLPTGCSVDRGQATLHQQSANTLHINQVSPNAFIKWDSFDIGAGHSVNFQVPSGGATLNQVNGPASLINGSLTSNGTLFLLNPNGMLFGASARVDVGSLVSSTAQLDSQKFMNGQYELIQASQGIVSNAGSINASSGGYVVFAGAGTLLNGGSITVPNGTVQMISAEHFTLTQSTDNPYLSINIGGQAHIGSHIHNSGSLTGATVVLKAPQGIVSHSGLIQANSLGDLTGRRVDIQGVVNSSGAISVNSSDSMSLVNAKLTADQNITLDSGKNLNVYASSLESTKGNVRLTSQGLLGVTTGSLISSQEGNMHLSGYSIGGASAVSINDSTLSATNSAKGGSRISVVGSNSATSSTDGIELNNAKLSAHHVDLKGSGFNGIHMTDSSLSAIDSLFVTGNGSGAKIDTIAMGVLFKGNNVLTATNLLHIDGHAAYNAITFTEGSFTTFNSGNTQVTGFSSRLPGTQNMAIDFSGSLNLPENGNNQFISNGFEVKPSSI